MRPIENIKYEVKIGDKIRLMEDGNRWRNWYIVKQIPPCHKCVRGNRVGGSCLNRYRVIFEGYPRAAFCINSNWERFYEAS